MRVAGAMPAMQARLSLQLALDRGDRDGGSRRQIKLPRRCERAEIELDLAKLDELVAWLGRRNVAEILGHDGQLGTQPGEVEAKTDHARIHVAADPVLAGQLIRQRSHGTARIHRPGYDDVPATRI